jgi:predicted cupin superfamily sugar epimerase
MQQDELPKTVKKAMRSLVALAHEAELRRALEEVYGNFQEWKSGRIDSFELADRIHKFHDGPNREVYLRYTGKLDYRWLVGHALEAGQIQKTAVPTEIWPYLNGFYSPDHGPEHS